MSNPLNIFYEQYRKNFYRGVKERYEKERKQFNSKESAGIFSIKLGRDLTTKEINNLLNNKP